MKEVTAVADYDAGSPAWLEGAMVRVILLAVAVAIAPQASYAQQPPMCSDFLTAMQTGRAAMFTNYAAQLYRRLDEQRVAMGRQPVGPVDFSSYSRSWAQLCATTPDQTFESVVLTYYSMGAAFLGR
jgi:hypothetical protein